MRAMIDGDGAAAVDAVAAIQVRARVSAKARRWDAESIAMQCRSTEHELNFTQHHGGPAGVVRQLAMELAEWRRIEQLLVASPGTHYTPEDDPVAVAAIDQERDREQAALDTQLAAQQAEKERRDRTLKRASELLDLVQARQLDASVPVQADDPEAWRMLRGHSPAAIKQIDAWMAQALAARSGALSDDAVRAAAQATLPQRVTAHAALLETLDATGRSGDLPFVGVLAQAAPEATAQLAQWLATTGSRGQAASDVAE
jgi:hypothetical protein